MRAGMVGSPVAQVEPSSGGECAGHAFAVGAVAGDAGAGVNGGTTLVDGGIGLVCADHFLGGDEWLPTGGVVVDDGIDSGADVAGVAAAVFATGKLTFISLLHHADVDALRRSFYRLKKTEAVGIDEVTWQDYEHGLEAKLMDLHGRLHR